MTVPKFQRMYEKNEGLACWPSALWTPRFPDTCQKNETPIRGKTRIPAFSKPLHLRGSPTGLGLHLGNEVLSKALNVAYVYNIYKTCA